MGDLTEKFPQIHLVNVFPQIGIADRRLVMTVAAQNDICPHGSTYPMKAVIINIRIIIVPKFQVVFNLNELFIIFFEMCIYKKIKNVDAPLMCSNRNKYPLLVSREMCETLLNASSAEEM